MGTETERLEAPGARRGPKRTSAELLDFAQVADWLNVSEASVRRLVSCGRLPSVPVTPSGRKRMISRAAVEAYIRDNEKPATPPAAPEATISEPRRARLARAGWDGDSHL